MKTQKAVFLWIGCLVFLGLLMLTGTVSGEPTYSISGRILFERGTPAVGVVLNDGAGHITTTDNSGEYTLSNLLPGTYTLTPSKAGCTFTPITRSVTIVGTNQTAVDFTATLHSYPSYAWHTFYGSANYDYGYAIALDDNDNVYITGKSGGDWGTPRHAGGDVFVMKLDHDGVYQWHTFYGASGEGNTGSGIAVDSSGNIYVTGSSSASWGSNPLNPFTPGVYPNQTDAFVLKLDPNGDYLWHTFYGANGADYGNDLSIDSGNNVFVTGMSDTSWGLPLHAHAGFYDVFVLKLDSSGTHQWHTFYGSSGQDDGNAIALDKSGNIYITGQSWTNWGSPLNSPGKNNDILVLKLDSNGTYQWHTFQGGADRESGLDIAVDGINVYVTGFANFGWGTPLNAFGESMQDAVILKLSASGAYQWHTFYGYGWSAGSELILGPNNSVYITGHTNSNWGLSIHEFNGDYDIFVLRLDGNGMPLWHTFYGGYGAANGADYGRAIALGLNGSIYVTGSAKSSEPEDVEWQSALHAHSGGSDMVVLKLGADTTTTLTSSSVLALFNQPFQFTATVKTVAAVKPVPGEEIITGTVQFQKNGSDWGAPVALVNGVATSPTTSSPSFDSYVVTAIYNGDTHFSTSVSYKIKQVVTDKLYPAYLPLMRR